MTYLRTGLSLTATLALTVSYLPPAFAQGGPGASGTLSITQGIEFSDNFDLDSATSGTTTTLRTGLSFGYQSVTRAESLQFQIGTQILGEYGGGANDEFEFENNTVSAGYTRQGANAALTFSGSYSEVDLEDSVISLGPSFGIGFGSGTLIIDDGQAAVTNLSASVQTGINAPFGLTLSASYFEEDFTGTSDPSLIDRDIVSFDALADFRVNPARSFRALAGISTESEAGAISDTDNSYIGVGVGGATAGGLNYTGDLLFDRSEFNGVVDDGFGVNISVTQERPRGPIGFDLASRIDDSGRRTSAIANRTIALPDGSLGFSLGVVDQEGDDSIRPTGSLSYQKDTKDGSLTASLTQAPSIDAGTVYGNTSLALGYTQSINAVSGWAADVTYTSVDELNGIMDDERTTARITYTRSLTPEWQMNTGFQHIREIEDSGPTETSNTVFFNIRRDITFGF
ncbi:MAG: hypothetical protein HKM96_12430 [Boseongicola sp.]|nr:hypothetical protein [Boseongicola sp.]